MTWNLSNPLQKHIFEEDDDLPEKLQHFFRITRYVSSIHRIGIMSYFRLEMLMISMIMLGSIPALRNQIFRKQKIFSKTAPKYVHRKEFYPSETIQHLPFLRCHWQIPRLKLPPIEDWGCNQALKPVTFYHLLSSHLCKLCGKQFDRRSNLYDHIINSKAIISLPPIEVWGCNEAVNPVVFYQLPSSHVQYSYIVGNWMKFCQNFKEEEKPSNIW